MFWEQILTPRIIFGIISNPSTSFKAFLLYTSKDVVGSNMTPRLNLGSKLHFKRRQLTFIEDYSSLYGLICALGWP